MRGQKSPLIIELTEEERNELKKWLRCTTMPVGLVRRAHAVLLIAEGKTITEAAHIVGFSRKIVRRWVSRFLEKRIEGLSDKRGRGRKPVFSPRGGCTFGETGM